MAEAGAAREDEESRDDGPTEEDHQDEEDEQNEQPQSDPHDDLCPVIDKNEKPFRLMDMPPEIRIEIYRACLTRPFDILLSRETKHVEQEKERERPRSAAVNDEHDVVELTEPPDDGGEDPRVDEHHDPPHFNGLTAPWAQRGMRALRSFTRYNNQRNAVAAAANNNTTPAANPNNLASLLLPTGPRNRMSNYDPNNLPPRTRRTVPSTVPSTPRAPRPQDVDPLLVNLMRVSKLIYKESRSILYGENNFLLDLDTAQPTLAALHQRSRGQIKYLRVTIPTHNEILERFAEVVRLSLRYCWRLQRFVIHTPFILPGAEGSSTSGNTTVYANAFDILRWLPRKCEVVLEGNVCEEIRKVVEKNLDLAKSLDEVSHKQFQLLSRNGYVCPPGGSDSSREVALAP